MGRPVHNTGRCDMALNPMMANPMIDGPRSGRGAVGAHSAGVNGIQAGLNGVADAAREIAEQNLQTPSGSAPGSDRLSETADALVDLRVYQRQVEASAVVVKTADAVVGFLLDVHA